MENMKPLIVEFMIGIILLGISFFVKNDYYSTMIFSMGIGLTAGAAAQIIRIIYWKNPKRQDANALGHQFLVQPAQVSRQILPAGAGAGKEISRLDSGQGGRTVTNQQIL